MRRTLAATAAVLLATLAACGQSDKPKATTSHTTSASPTRTVSSHTPAKTGSSGGTPAGLSTAEARKKAAGILIKEDQDFRDFLAKGEDAVGTPQFTAWYQKAIVGLDMKQTAFTKADGLFTAKNEPTDLIQAWRSDNSDADTAISQYATDGTDPDAPNAKTRKDAADWRAALEKADKDAAKIANGS